MVHAASMQRTLTFQPSDISEVESNPAFNVLIAYEDFETGKQAKKTYDFLAENLASECVLTNQMWKFDVLSIPKLREIAVRDATLADIILISSRGDDLPIHATKWIESWLMEGTHAIALVALFEKPENQNSQSSQARKYLAEVARRGHMEFFAQPDDWPGRIHPRFFHNHNRTFSTLAGAVRRDVTTHWGINE